MLEGNLADDDAEPLVVLFDRRTGADDDGAPAGVVSAADARTAANDATGRKIGARHDFEQLVDRDIGLVDHADQGVADLAEVVRRDRRGHAHRDAVGAVHEQVREFRRQHARLGSPLVVGRYEIDRVELDVVHHQRGDGRHPGLGVPHGRGRQTGDRAEVSLLVDQHVAHVPFLGHADQRGVDHTFAVRMVISAGIAGDLGALHPAGARREIQVVHRDQDSALRRLQPVAHVGQGPADDHAHRVRQIAALQLVLDGNIQQPLGGQTAGVWRRGSLRRGILGGWRFGREIRVGQQGKSSLNTT